MKDARYAIFFVPPQDSALTRFGAKALGYDSYSGRELPSLSGDGISAAEWKELTSEPRRYGFHATLKAPFHLRNGVSEDDLTAAFAAFAAGHEAPPRFAASLKLLDGFAALVPSAPVAMLDALAAACVRDFDQFRQPLTDAERERRLVHPLTERQADHLDRWGYPYVLEDFRFHMTLTGRLPAPRAQLILEFLHRALAREQVPADIAVDTVALLRQDEADARFYVIRDVTLASKASAADDRIAANG